MKYTPKQHSSLHQPDDYTGGMTNNPPIRGKGKECPTKQTEEHRCSFAHCGNCGNCPYTPHSFTDWEKGWKKVEEELKYVATYASPDRREELLRFLKGLFDDLLQHHLEAAREEGYKKGRADENEWFKSGDGVIYLREKDKEEGRQQAFREVLEVLTKIPSELGIYVPRAAIIRAIKKMK